jgi:probable rRNA maturation factor
MMLGIFNHQDQLRVDIGWLERIGTFALPLCLASPGKHATPLSDLEEVEVSLLDNEAMAKLNEEFLQHDGPTDVITFDHGEILIGVEVAEENAENFGTSLNDELALYIVHGLLHLNGWEDKDPAEGKEMAELQATILGASIQLSDQK